MRQHIEPFIDDLKSTHGRNLRSVILYGSAAAGDFVRHQSDYNILIALDKIGPADLSAAHAAVREWVRMGHPVPVYFTVSELESAADVFPIEFHQMQDAREVLYGADVLANVRITDKYLRHQIEYELRSKLLLLRRRYIPSSESVEGLKALMAESLPSFATLFGAVLILRGIKPPATKHEIIAMTAQHLGISGVPFEKVLNIRENNFTERLDEKQAIALFGDYLEQIEKVIASVDSLSQAAI
jgi:predicted nucleotidyltransferase